MSLFFKDRIDEQSGDPSNDKITFTYPWIIQIPTDDDGIRPFSKILRTSYNICTEVWHLTLRENFLSIMFMSNYNVDEGWIGSCFVSYKLFYDNDMRFEFHSSNKVSAARPQNSDTFRTPDGFLTKFYDAYEARKISKYVIFVELVLPTKLFFRPFDHPSSALCKSICDEYPKDMGTNFVFQFLKHGDFTIQCSDGSTPASRCVLNVSSIFMNKHFKHSSSDKLIVEFSLDVIEPLMLYLHSYCFQMPKCFSLDFADQLIKAINFFQPIQKRDIEFTVQRALCKKFSEVSEFLKMFVKYIKINFSVESFNFDSLLQWMSVAYQNSLSNLEEMICVKIAYKYYYKWHQTFPENARNIENPIYRDIFDSEEDFCIFRLIEQVFTELLFVKAILH